MNEPLQPHVNKAVDSIQQCITEYAHGFAYESLSGDAIHAAKMRVIDTLGALVGGFFGEPCRIARNLAARMPNADGATIIGTRMKTSLDMAAFVNGTTARYLEANDAYYYPGGSGGHPSDVVAPIVAAAEHAHVAGRELISAVVLAYEIFLRISDAIHTPGFDSTNFCCIASAAAVAKLLGLPCDQLSHAIALAVVPNNALLQGRTGHISMYKAAASGQAARAGVFAALLAREGMAGPHLPFEGKSGWCELVARKRFSLGTLGGNGMPFKIQDSWIKQRYCCANTMSAILAAEKIAPALNDVAQVEHVTVEVDRRAKTSKGTGEYNWNPESRETADHSIPYGVAAALMDGKVTPRSFNDDHLWNPRLRALMQKIEVLANDEFTRAYEQLPVTHRARVTVLTIRGERLAAESGADNDGLSAKKSDSMVTDKFRELTEDALGGKRVNAILDQLLHLEDIKDVAAIPSAFVLA